LLIIYEFNQDKIEAIGSLNKLLLIKMNQKNLENLNYGFNGSSALIYNTFIMGNSFSVDFFLHFYILMVVHSKAQ